MLNADPEDLDWRKSSYCCESNCVEVAYATLDAILVRDSKARNAGHLTFMRAEWRTFIVKVRADAFDLDT
jgi:hypothetical protein